MTQHGYAMPSPPATQRIEAASLSENAASNGIARKDEPRGVSELIHDEKMGLMDAELKAAKDELNVSNEELRTINEALVRQRDLLSGTLSSVGEAASAAVIATDAYGKVNFINSAACRLTGRTAEQSLGRQVQNVLIGLNGWESDIARDIAARVRMALRGETSADVEYTLLRRDIGETHIGSYGFSPIQSAGGAIIGAIILGRDITEKRKAEDRLRQAQKLESLAVLASGIAHDFNNLLGVVLANAELLSAEIPECSEGSQSVETIKSLAIRGAEIVRALMAYAGQENQRFRKKPGVNAGPERSRFLSRVGRSYRRKAASQFSITWISG